MGGESEWGLMKKYPRILHYPGSKWTMANWIIEHMPEHHTYLEPFFGSGAVLFNKQPSKSETINDLDGQVVNLFRVIRDRPQELAEKIFWTPYSREEYYAAYESSEDELESARRFLVRCWMAIGAKTSDRTGWKSNTGGDQHNRPRDWIKLPQKIMDITERLKEVQIEQQPFEKILDRYNRSNVLIYADPPYILETRTKRHYKHEMDISDHELLLEQLDGHPGPVLLSGYAHELYDTRLKKWHRETFEAVAEAGAKRTEVLWFNEVAAEHFGQQSIFSLLEQGM